MAIDPDIVRGLINAIDEPVFIVVPNSEMDDDEYIKLFQTLESVLERIEKRLNVDFDVLIESAIYFGGYREMSNLADEQLEREEEEGDDGDNYQATD